MARHLISRALLAAALALAATQANATNIGDPSVGINGAASPGSSAQIGCVDGSGNLRPASTSNPCAVQVPGVATSAKQDAQTSDLDAIKTATQAGATQTTLAAFLSANHTDLAAVLAKITSDPATQTTLAAVLAKLSSDPATQTTLAAVLAKLSSDPATQTTLQAFLTANHTDEAAILAKLSSDPATQTTLAAVLAKLTSDPSTASNQTSANTKLDTLHTDIGTTVHADLNTTIHGDLTTQQANAGSDASKAVAVQGVTGGKALNVSPDNVVDGAVSTASVSSATTVLTFPNTAGYGYIAFGFTSVGSGNAIIAEGAVDGSTYTTAVSWNTASVSGSVGGSFTPATTGMYVVPVTAQSMRIRVSTYSSGTVTAFGILKRGSVPPPPSLGSIASNVSVVGNIASGSADSSGPVKMGCKFNSTLPTFTDGQRADCQAGTKGQVLTAVTGTTATQLASTSGFGEFDNTGNPRAKDVAPFLYDGTNMNIAQGAQNGTNSTGAGIAAGAGLAQFDDVSPTSITENQFGNLRMSANRVGYTQIRDAAGNERGANVTVGNALQVDASATTQPVSAATLPLPSGASTSANQTTGNSSLATIATNTTGAATGTNVTETHAAAGNDATKAEAIQGVTGGKAVAISASSLPLPANAAQETGGNLATIATASASQATASNQTSANTKLDTLHTDIGTTVHADLGTLTGTLNLVVTPTDRGGTIATGGASQTQIAANASRKGCWIENPVNATEDLYISSTASAVTTGGSPDDADLAPGGSWTCNIANTVIQTAIRVNAATTGHAFIAKEIQ